MRGSHRSRQQADIVAEAKALIADGVKEIELISQDSTYYGLDLRPNHSRAISSPEKFSAAAKSLAADSTTICTLLRELNSLEGDFWIRLLYTHPAHWTDELIQTIAECPKVARYVDIPLQHIHENMLERMRRETSQQYIVDLHPENPRRCAGHRAADDFHRRLSRRNRGQFQACSISSAKRSSSGSACSPIRKRTDTLPGQWPGKFPTKSNSSAANWRWPSNTKSPGRFPKAFVGREIKVLVEGRADAKQLQDANVSSWEHGLVRDIKTLNPQLSTLNYLTARGEADAPDIDGRVYVRVPQNGMPVGEFAKVKIAGHTDYDLIAEMVK